MRRVCLAGLAATAMLGGSANAAELARPAPVYLPPAPVVSYFNWTGCYVGANAGGLWSRTDWTDQIPGDPALGADFGSHAADGAAGGVQGGCHYQAGGWVFGLLGDYDWTNASSSNANLVAAALTDQTQIKSLASVTGRVGYAWDRFLGYVKGGGASVQRKYSFLFGGAVIATSNERRGGWTVGIGGEYAFFDWLTGFVEYDYYKFGSGSDTLACAGCGLFAPIVQFNVTTNINVFKVGLNFTMPDAWDPQRSKSTPRR
jgi:outer membrane immunogenic protein